jgi:hypothetical protein
MTDAPDTLFRELPAPGDLGPDPELPGVRAGWLLERVASECYKRCAPCGDHDGTRRQRREIRAVRGQRVTNS